MTNKHKHANMIIAKANNMDLVVFYFDSEDEEWRKCSFEMMINYDAPTKCFLCLPKHEEACLHWLNGGETQTDRSFERFVSVDAASDYDFKWWKDGWFMQEDYKSRIKPRKEKRWIAVN